MLNVLMRIKLDECTLIQIWENRKEFKIGDDVSTEYGIGKIKEINYLAEPLIVFDGDKIKAVAKEIVLELI